MAGSALLYTFYIHVCLFYVHVRVCVCTHMCLYLDVFINLGIHPNCFGVPADHFWVIVEALRVWLVTRQMTQ